MARFLFPLPARHQFSINRPSSPGHAASTYHYSLYCWGQAFSQPPGAGRGRNKFFYPTYVSCVCGSPLSALHYSEYSLTFAFLSYFSTKSPSSSPCPAVWYPSLSSTLQTVDISSSNNSCGRRKQTRGKIIKSQYHIYF